MVDSEVIPTEVRIVFSIILTVHTAAHAFKFQTGRNLASVEMDIETTLRESRAETLKTPLHFRTVTGEQQFSKQLRKFTANIGILQRRQETLCSFRKTMTSEKETQINSLFETIREAEPELAVFFERTDVESDSYGQLLFSGWKPLQVLNTIPFVLFALSFYKQFIVPALAVMMPLAMVLMPFLFLKYVYNLPITTDQYIQIMMSMFGLQNLDLTNPRTVLQGSLTLFSIGQSIYQPIQNALHLQTIHAQMMKKANALQDLLRCIEQLETHFGSKHSFQDLYDQDQDIHRLFGTFWDNPFRLRLALSYVGDCEVVYRLARASFLEPVNFLQGTKPWLDLSGGGQPAFAASIPYQLRLSGPTHHAILTGPNRGGKSSVLRATLLNIVLAQTFGMASYDSSGHFRLRPFDWIATGLRLEDRPGTTSMFESEVEFSIQILQRANQHPDQIGLVLFDELFHSTNPPDGARTADIFLQTLWKTPNTASFISTHVFDLAKKAPRRIQKLCVPAYRKEDGSLQFTYTLKKGICEVSSVDEILKEKGLLETAEKPVPENPRQ
jgi:hypothetical protein